MRSHASELRRVACSYAVLSLTAQKWHFHFHHSCFFNTAHSHDYILDQIANYTVVLYFDSTKSESNC